MAAIEKLSVVVRNWQRPANLAELILPALERADFIDEIIISHGRADTEFAYEAAERPASPRVKITHRQDAALNAKYGLARGFFAAREARNPAVLMLDDDVLVPTETLADLLAAWQRAPEVMHGLVGRNPTANLTYDWNVAVRGAATIVLVKCCVMSRDLAVAACDQMESERKLARMVAAMSKYTPRWNGEEIFASLLAIKLSGELNQAHALDWSELPDDIGSGISTRSPALHLKIRTMMLRYLVKKWEIKSKIAVDSPQTV